jgi:Fe-S cluster assembly protein SufD
MSVLVEKADLSLKYTAHYNEVKESLRENSADVLNAPRNKAFQNFVMQGIPTRKNENYKYTNLQPQFYPEYRFIHQREPAEVDLNAVFRCDVPQLDTHLAFIFNGWYYDKNQQVEKLPDGVILESLDKMANEKPDLLAKYASLANTGEDPLVALNTAFAKDGYFLYVPKNTVIEKSI